MYAFRYYLSFISLRIIQYAVSIAIPIGFGSLLWLLLYSKVAFGVIVTIVALPFLIEYARKNRNKCRSRKVAPVTPVFTKPSTAASEPPSTANSSNAMSSRQGRRDNNVQRYRDAMNGRIPFARTLKPSDLLEEVGEGDVSEDSEDINNDTLTKAHKDSMDESMLDTESEEGVNAAVLSPEQRREQILKTLVQHAGESDADFELRKIFRLPLQLLTPEQVALKNKHLLEEAYKRDKHQAYFDMEQYLMENHDNEHITDMNNVIHTFLTKENGELYSDLTSEAGEELEDDYNVNLYLEMEFNDDESDSELAQTMDVGQLSPGGLEAMTIAMPASHSPMPSIPHVNVPVATSLKLKNEFANNKPFSANGVSRILSTTSRVTTPHWQPQRPAAPVYIEGEIMPSNDSDLSSLASSDEEALHAATKTPKPNINTFEDDVSGTMGDSDDIPVMQGAVGNINANESHSDDFNVELEAEGDINAEDSDSDDVNAWLEAEDDINANESHSDDINIDDSDDINAVLEAEDDINSTTGSNSEPQSER